MSQPANQPATPGVASSTAGCTSAIWCRMEKRYSSPGEVAVPVNALAPPLAGASEVERVLSR